MTLGVLAPYRRYGIGTLPIPSPHPLGGIHIALGRYTHREVLTLGTKLLDHVLAQAEEQNKASKEPVRSLYLHVQTTNQEAVDWYSKRGFEIQETVQGYYRNIDDRDAYILARKL